MERVAVVQLGEAADAAQTTPSTDVVLAVRRRAEVRSECRQPRLIDRAIDEVEQRPARPFRQPWVLVGPYARRSGDGVADQSVRERKVDVRADAVGAAVARAERCREALGEPPLDPARRHRDHLGRERVGRWFGQYVAERTVF